MLDSLKSFLQEYWSLVQPPTQLELEMKCDRKFAEHTGWMRLGALERERQAVADFKFP